MSKMKFAKRLSFITWVFGMTCAILSFVLPVGKGFNYSYEVLAVLFPVVGLLSFILCAWVDEEE